MSGERYTPVGHENQTAMNLSIELASARVPGFSGVYLMLAIRGKTLIMQMLTTLRGLCAHSSYIWLLGILNVLVNFLG